MKYAGINYIRIGTDESKSFLLFLHGLTGNMRRWEYYVQNLRRDYNILAVDLIGHGDSDFPDQMDDYSYVKQASDLLGLIENRGIKNITLVCHSYSFGIALEMMRQDRSKFKSIITISPLLITPDYLRKYKIRFLALPIFLWKLLIHKRKTGKFIYPKNSSEYSFFDFKRGLNEIGIKSYTAHINSIKTAPNLESYSRIDIPAVLIYKDKDRLFNDSHVNIFKEIFPNTKDHRLSGSGHLFLLQDQEKILNVIKNSLLT